MADNRKEITIQPALNEYEAINRAADVKLWLHDLLDEQIRPATISIETLLQVVNLYFELTDTLADLESRVAALEGN